MQITGATTFVDVEGGFWGILGDDGIPYHPVNGFPEAFQVESLRIKASVKPYDGVSVFMWGKLIEVEEIELLEK